MEAIACQNKLQSFESTLGNTEKDLPPRCQSILLHLGHRVSLLKRSVEAAEQEHLNVILGRVLAYLSKFFYSKRQQDDIGLDRFFKESETPGVSQEQDDQVPKADQDVLGSLRRLGLIGENNMHSDEGIRTGLLQLEQELYNLRKFKEVHSDRQPPNIIDSGIRPSLSQATYTGTIPKQSGSDTAGFTRQVRFTDSDAWNAGTQSGNATSTSSLGNHYWGNSMWSEASRRPGTSFPDLMGTSAPRYPAINTLTNPTLSNTAPRMASSIRPNAGYNFPTVTTTTYLAPPCSWPNVPPVGGHSPPFPFTHEERWKVTPYITREDTPTPHWSSSIHNSVGTPMHYPITDPFTDRRPGSMQYPISGMISATNSPVLGSTIGQVSSPFSSMGSSVSVGAGGMPYIPQPAIDAFPKPYGRKSLPVSKWKLDKYAGTDQGLKLNEFLHLVSQLALSENVSEPELFDSAFHLFTGPALNWYMSMRSASRLVNWAHLVVELRKTFAHPELDSLVRARIYQRRQQRGETFQDFYYEMESMFRSMINPMNEWERVDVLRRNMRTDYKKALLWKPISSLSELLEADHMIDASNFSLFAKVFGSEKSTNVVSEGKPRRDEQKPSDRFHPNSKFSEKTYSKKEFKQNTSKNEKTHEPKPQNNSSKPVGNEPPQEGSSKPSRTLEFLVNGYKPPRTSECLYCRQPNHSVEQCRNYKGLMCLVCGFKGFETQNCPYCKKNGLQTFEKRRPSSPHPHA